MNEVFKALSDPTRREILRILSRGERTAGELAEPFDMTKASMSHHFAVLKEADPIRSRREGPQVIYSLNTAVVEDVLARIWDLYGTNRDDADGHHDWMAISGIVPAARPVWAWIGSSAGNGPSPARKPS